MIQVETLKAEHLKTLVLQPEQEYFKHLIDDPDQYIEMVSGGEAFALVADGETMCVGGLIELWPERALFWSLMSANCKPYMLHIVRTGIRMIRMFAGKRVESTVDCNFKQGHRLMRLMGFEMEAERMRSYEPDGRDCALYARVN